MATTASKTTPQRRFPRQASPFGLLLLVAVHICPGTARSVRAVETTNASPVAVWDATVRGTVGVGYRDNILRTSVAPESSGFFISSVDASAMRLSETGSQLLFFVMGEDVRYFDSRSVPKEQLYSGTVQGALPLGTSDELGAMLQYLYQNQVVDASETEVNLRRVLVEGHGLTFRPQWEHTLRPGWVLQLEGSMDRQIYVAELDDFWEGAGRLSLIHKYARRSEWSVSFQSKHRLYDSREQFDSGGVAIPNTSLVYWRPELGGQWRHCWDEQRHWRTATKAAFLRNQDNGSGYFDYNRVLFSQQLRWSHHGWEIRGNARFGWYFYDTQRVAGELRERSYCALDVRVERRLAKHWFLYATAEREWNMSNDPLDDYRDWMAGGGIGAEF